MSSSRLKDIQNAVYEMEGLVQLALEGKHDSALLNRLMTDKAASILALCQEFAESKTVTSPAPAQPEPVVFEKDESEDGDILHEEEVIVEDEEETNAPAAQANTDNCNCELKGDESLAAATLFEAKNDAAGNPPERHAAPEPPKTPESAKAPEAPEAPEVPKKSRSHALRRLFFLNDVFLFRRELFNGSDVDFNASLAVVEELPDYAAAEDYFFNDLQWNPDSQTVQNFLKVIKKYFKK